MYSALTFRFEGFAAGGRKASRIDQMWKGAGFAIAMGHPRHGNPRCRVGQILDETGARRVRKAQSVARIAGRCGGKMFSSARRMRKQRFAPFDILREAARREHYAAARSKNLRALRRLGFHRAYRAIFDNQLAGGRG